MVRKADFGKRRALYGRTVVIAFLALLVAGCGGLLGGSPREAKTELWKHRDQFVRLESQDRGATPPPANEHPARLSPELVRNMLGSLQVHFKGDEKPVPVFTFRQLELLGEVLSRGLAQAGPRQDVTFAIVGIHREFISFSTDRSVSTYRLFVQDGRVNLIIGTLHAPYIENLDRRINPLVPGSRRYTPPDPRRRITHWQIVPRAGLEFKTADGRTRGDWLVLNIDEELWKGAMAEQQEATETAREAFREAAQVREDSAQLEAEQQRLREEMAEIQRTLDALKQAPAPAPAPVPVVPTPGLEQIEQRLRTLQQLRDRGLISEEEFRARRLDILDGI